MKNIVFTTLFAGCLVASSAMADCAAAFKAGEFDFGVKASVGAIFGNLKNTPYTKKSVLGGLAFTTQYNISQCFGIGLEVFYDFYNIKKGSEISTPLTNKEKSELNYALQEVLGKDTKIRAKSNIKAKSLFKTRGRFGALVTVTYAPTEHMSLYAGVGITKPSKVKNEFTFVEGFTNGGTDFSSTMSIAIKSKLAPIFKLGAEYRFNNNLSAGIEGTYSCYKYKNNFASLSSLDSEKLKIKTATVAATVKYTF